MPAPRNPHAELWELVRGADFALYASGGATLDPDLALRLVDRGVHIVERAVDELAEVDVPVELRREEQQRVYNSFADVIDYVARLLPEDIQRDSFHRLAHTWRSSYEMVQEHATQEENAQRAAAARPSAAATPPTPPPVVPARDGSFLQPLDVSTVAKAVRARLHASAPTREQSKLS